MRIIFLKGDWDHMGRTFAQKLSPQGLESIRYLTDSSNRVSLHMFQKKGLLSGATKVFLNTLLKFKARQLREEDKSFLSAAAEALGMNPGDLTVGFASPDFFNYLLSFSDRLLKRGVPSVLLGCSSVVVHSDATETSNLYHGRNLDYIGGKYWEKGHCLLVMKPKGKLASVTITSEGIYAPGVTTINEAGIGISLHLNFTRKIRFANTPITTIASRIATEARSLSDAIDMLRKTKPMSGWSFIISDATRREAAILELSAENLSVVHPQDNMLWFTNMYLSPQQQKDEYAPSYVWVQNNHARYNRLKTLLLENKGTLNAQNLIKILGDSNDPIVGRDTALGDTVSNAANISSALMCYEEDAIWVSTGRVPANRGDFVKYSISKLLEGKAEPEEIISGNRLPDYKEKAFREFTLACFEWEESCNPAKVLPHLNKAVFMDLEEPLYRLVRAWLTAKEGDYQQAIEDLKAVVASNISPLRKAQTLLWLGRMLDIAGNREEAIANYREAIRTCPAYDIQKLAWKGIKKPYKPGKLKLTDILPFVADTVEA